MNLNFSLLPCTPLLSGLGLNRGDGVAGFVRGGAVGCRGGDGSPGFAATQTGCQRCEHYREQQEAEPVEGATA